MVLFGTVSFTSKLRFDVGLKTFKIEAKKGTFEDSLISCIRCNLNRNMASIPPSAFSAGRIRQTQQPNSRDMKISKTARGNESPKFFDTSLMELSPLKYISKLMNSIWGSYNRYSPHNVKKINDALVLPVAGDSQQTPANNKNEAMIILPSKLDNVWAAMNVSQSH